MEVIATAVLQIAGGDPVDGLSHVTLSDAERLLGRHGLKRGSGYLYFSNTNDARDGLMAKTKFNTDLKGALLRVPGANRGNGTKRFSGIGSLGFFFVPLTSVFGAEEAF
jgi:hypothetical protein